MRQRVKGYSVVVPNHLSSLNSGNTNHSPFGSMIYHIVHFHCYYYCDPTSNWNHTYKEYHFVQIVSTNLLAHNIELLITEKYLKCFIFVKLLANIFITNTVKHEEMDIWSTVKMFWISFLVLVKELQEFHTLEEMNIGFVVLIMHPPVIWLFSG